MEKKNTYNAPLPVHGYVEGSIETTDGNRMHAACFPFQNALEYAPTKRLTMVNYSIFPALFTRSVYDEETVRYDTSTEHLNDHSQKEHATRKTKKRI